MTVEESRAYTSPLRAEQAAATRDRILDAAVRHLSEGASELTMADVAQRAGVSVRTAYRHFANPDELLDAVIEWINAQVISGANRPRPSTPEELADLAPVATDIILNRMEPLYRALFATEVGRRSHRRGAGYRHREINGAFATEMAGLDDEQTPLFGALAHLVTSTNASLFFKDYWGLTPEQIGRLMHWAVLAIAAAVRDPDMRGQL